MSAAGFQKAVCCGVGAVGSCCQGMSRKCGERVTKLAHVAFLGIACIIALIFQRYGSAMVYDVKIADYAPFQVGCINGHTGFNVTVPFPSGVPTWAQQTNSIWGANAASKVCVFCGRWFCLRVLSCPVACG